MLITPEWSGLKKLVMLNAATSDKELPIQYRRKTYLQSTGEQYILTDLTYVYGYKIHLETTDTSLPNETHGYFGWYAPSSQNNMQTYYNEPRHTVVITRDTSGSQILDVGFPINGEIAVNGLNISANGHDYIAKAIPTDINVKFVLFAYNRNTGVPSLCGNCRIRYAKFYDSNGEMTGNFIPCQRKSDNTLGMYDTVSKKFYTNAGTGTFISD